MLSQDAALDEPVATLKRFATALAERLPVLFAYDGWSTDYDRTGVPRLISRY
jgi:hypothetical protein